MTTDERLRRLEELTANLPGGPPGGPVSRVLIYDLDNGVGYAVGLFKNHTVAILLATLSANSSLSRYASQSQKWIVVIEGKGSVTMEDGTVAELGPGDAIEIPPNTGFSWKIADETVRALGITIPADPDYPDGP